MNKYNICISSGTSSDWGPHLSKSADPEARAICRPSLQKYSVGYKKRRSSRDLAVSMELERNSKLPTALREDDVKSRIFPWWRFFGSLLYQTSTEQIGFSLLKKSRFCKKVFGLARAHQYTKKCMLESRDEFAFWTTSAARYEQGLGATLFA